MRLDIVVTTFGQEIRIKKKDFNIENVLSSELDFSINGMCKILLNNSIFVLFMTIIFSIVTILFKLRSTVVPPPSYKRPHFHYRRDGLLREGAIYCS